MEGKGGRGPGKKLKKKKKKEKPMFSLVYYQKVSPGFPIGTFVAGTKIRGTNKACGSWSLAMSHCAVVA